MKRHIEYNQDFFKNNRKKFVEKMEPNAIAIFHSGDMFTRSADALHSFYQNPDLYYLTGIDQEETVLVMYPDSSSQRFKEVLFIRETNEEIRLWEGDKYSMEQAKEISGIDTIIWTKNYQPTLDSYINKVQNIYVNLNEHTRAHYDGDYMDLRKFKELKEKFPLHTYKKSAPILARLRMAKEASEIEWTQKAADITTNAFVKLLKEIKNFKYEHEVESFLTYEFNKNFATHAYDPIIACGENACVLHYVDNNKELKNGELLLMDFGAFYSNYCADMSRTIPIGGKFSERQKEVYQACLNTFKHAKNNLSTNIKYAQWHEDTGAFMQSELVRIGLLSSEEAKDKSAYRKYFPHGTGHSLGLNVHDVDNRDDNFPENMIITNEPGIYIREEGIGVRIENDIVIQKNGLLDLMETTPIEIEEIEDLMN